MRQCTKCGTIKPWSEFYRDRSSSTLHGTRCKSCVLEYRRSSTVRARYNATRLAWLHSRGICHPMQEYTECSAYLGVHIAERVLESVFRQFERMPYGTSGYDFICGRGYKIDVKSSTRHYGVRGNPSWSFDIRCNSIADYFLCIAFDSRSQLDPVHLWLVPGDVVRSRKNLRITDSEGSLEKWAQYERIDELKRVSLCCSDRRLGAKT